MFISTVGARIHHILVYFVLHIVWFFVLLKLNGNIILYPTIACLYHHYLSLTSLALFQKLV